MSATRKRRSAAETKEEILGIAADRLRSGGPGAIRLDELGRALGISRQAILHHFGSREGLLREVVRRAWTGLFADLQSLTRFDGAFEPESFIARVDEVTRKRGNARLGAWLLLTEEGLPEAIFQDALAQLPRAMAGGDESGGAMSKTQAQHLLLLLGSALFGDAIFGKRLRQAIGMPDTEESRRQFHGFIAQGLRAFLSGQS
jgi:AcrR family transcriptional regulator